MTWFCIEPTAGKKPFDVCSLQDNWCQSHHYHGLCYLFHISSCKEHPIVPRVFVKDWSRRNGGVGGVHFVLNLCFLVYIYPRFLSYEEQLLLQLMEKVAENQLSSRQPVVKWRWGVFAGKEDLGALKSLLRKGYNRQPRCGGWHLRMSQLRSNSPGWKHRSWVAPVNWALSKRRVLVVMK